MPKFTKEIEVNAVQFTGNNWKTVQEFVGSRPLDPAGKYTIPQFDEADTWAPDRGETSYKAVLNINGMWIGVEDGSWILKDDVAGLTIMTDEQFQSEYGTTGSTKKGSK